MDPAWYGTDYPKLGFGFAALAGSVSQKVRTAFGMYSVLTSRSVLEYQVWYIAWPGLSTLPCLRVAACIAQQGVSPPLTLPYPSFLLRINGPLLASLLLASIDSHFPIRAPWSCWPGPQSLFSSHAFLSFWSGGFIL